MTKEVFQNNVIDLYLSIRKDNQQKNRLSIFSKVCAIPQGVFSWNFVLGEVELATEDLPNQLRSFVSPETAAKNLCELIEKELPPPYDWANFWKRFNEGISNPKAISKEWPYSKKVKDYIDLLILDTKIRVNSHFLNSMNDFNDLESEFDMNEIYFADKANIPTDEKLAGRKLVFVCCDLSLRIIEGLRQFHPDKKNVKLFLEAFSGKHPLRIYDREKGYDIFNLIKDDDLIARTFSNIRHRYQQIENDDLKIYFLNSVELELDFQRALKETGRWEADVREFMDKWNTFKNGLKDLESVQNLEPEEPAIPIKNKDFTTARQVLAMHYLFEYCKVKEIDQTHKARFIEFLTGKNEKNIYEAVRNPFQTKANTFRVKDLQYIREHFENLGLDEIVKMINNQLDKIGGKNL